MKSRQIVHHPAHTATSASFSMLPGVDETSDILHERMNRQCLLTGRDAPEKTGKPRPTDRETWQPEQPPAQAPDEISAPLRLSAWILSIGVAIFALPVGAMLMVFNLTRGADLRLASQTAALTGMFIALVTCGWAAVAMAAFSGFTR